MAEYFFDLGQNDQREALEYAHAGTGRSTHCLTNDDKLVLQLTALAGSAAHGYTR